MMPTEEQDQVIEVKLFISTQSFKSLWKESDSETNTALFSYLDENTNKKENHCTLMEILRRINKAGGSLQSNLKLVTKKLSKYFFYFTGIKPLYSACPWYEPSFPTTEN